MIASNGKFFKNGAVVIICGYTGEGKSPLIKKIIEASNLSNRLVFDSRREYNVKEWTVFYDFEIFRQSMTHAKQAAIVFEEATAHISAFSNQELAEIYTASEHNLNLIFMVFHSLGKVPNELIQNAHYMVLFNTIDTEDSLGKLRKIFVPLLKLPKPVFVNVRQLVGAEQ